MLTLQAKRLRPGAALPTRGHRDDAGFDLHATAMVVISPGQARRVGTGIAVGLPRGWCGRIVGRSSTGARAVLVAGGLIDPGFTGEVEVILVNVGRETYCVYPGDRVAQLVLSPSPDVELVEVDELEPGPRGAAGFGSTGV